MIIPDTLSARNAWSQYWSGDQAGADRALNSELQEWVLDVHWAKVFAREFRARPNVRLLDAACGTGILALHASRVAQFEEYGGLDICLSDISPEALDIAKAKLTEHPAGTAVADARDLPFPDAHFDVIVSQFGLEYAGSDGFREAIRCLNPEGSLHAVIHRAGSGIMQECEGNLAVLDALTDSGILTGFLTVFRHAREGGEGAEAKAALESVAASVDQVQAALVAAPPGGAREYGARLLIDMQNAMDQPMRYSESDMESWVEGQGEGIQAFRVRMASMIESAMSEDDVRAIADALGERKGIAVSVETMQGLDGDAAVAWVLTAAP